LTPKKRPDPSPQYGRSHSAIIRCIALLGRQFLPECSWRQDPYRPYSLEALKFSIASHHDLNLACDCGGDYFGVVAVLDVRNWLVPWLGEDYISRDELKIFRDQAVGDRELRSENALYFLKDPSAGDEIVIGENFSEDVST
jgi:hypothetical protein